MIRKEKQKKEAIALRKSGHTYGEILKKVPVAKSTLSLWLRDVGLAKKQVQKMTAKKKAAQLRGGARRRETRIEVSEEIYAQSMQDIGSLTKRELLLIGTALYWAEGAKAKEYRPSVRVTFSNSDPAMVRLFVRWACEFLGVKKDTITITVYIHENHKHRIKSLETYWLTVAELNRSSLMNPVYKKHNPKTIRKNNGLLYKGLVSISIGNSTNLNRRIQGWIYGIISSQK